LYGFKVQFLFHRCEARNNLLRVLFHEAWLHTKRMCVRSSTYNPSSAQQTFSADLLSRIRIIAHTAVYQIKLSASYPHQGVSRNRRKFR